MVMKICLLNFDYYTLFFGVIFLIFVSEAIAGGLHIRKEDLKLNGYPPDSTFRPNQKIVMSYTAEDYSYSAGHRRF